MSESGQRGRVVRALRELDAVAVENPARPGTPDVNYIDGWIELKWLRRWPARSETPVAIDHYTKQQRAWARRRIRRGGACWWLLQVGREWLLLDGAVAALHVGEATREELINLADHYWPNGLRDKELVECLR